MKKDTAPEADGFNNDKNGGSAVPSVGVEPYKSPFDRPLRKRGYHRALKRGDGWAVMRKATNDMMLNIYKNMFGIEL